MKFPSNDFHVNMLHAWKPIINSEDHIDCHQTAQHPYEVKNGIKSMKSSFSIHCKSMYLTATHNFNWTTKPSQFQLSTSETQGAQKEQVAKQHCNEQENENVYQHRFFPWWACKWEGKFQEHERPRMRRRACRDRERPFWETARRRCLKRRRERPSSAVVAGEPMWRARGSASWLPSFLSQISSLISLSENLSAWKWVVTGFGGSGTRVMPLIFQLSFVNNHSLG